jgi:phospholipase C
MVTTQPSPGPAIAPFVTDPATDAPLSNADMAALLRTKVKYVFVIFNENHSFDNEYGTFPGVNGLYSDGSKPRAASATPGFTQSFKDLAGTQVTVQPYLLGPQQNSTFLDSVDHSHKGLAMKIDVQQDGTPKMDQFSLDEYLKYAKQGNTASQAMGLQFAKLVMSHTDCDTTPFYWNYANRFTIFDNIFATEDTPSTPNAIAMIAGQSGETQWVKHGTNGFTGPTSGTINGKSYSGTATTSGVPVVNDPNSIWGSEFDTTASNRSPTSPGENYPPGNIAPNLTFATVPLTAMGSAVTQMTGHDIDGGSDLADISKDVPYIQSLGRTPVAWGWYQNGYDLEPNDNGTALHKNYVAHHAAPPYFGYLTNNPVLRADMHGEEDFFADVAAHRLPKDGGVFYIRGGFFNIKGQTPPIQNADFPAHLTPTDISTINANKAGDDDHPGYTDRQLSEAMNARVINAVANDPELWSQSAIILTYDESDGFYDHVPPRILSYGPDSLPLARGIRVPLLLISPYARAHAVSHAEGDHNSVIETINAVFNLPPLSSLPDEAEALKAGDSAEFNKFAPEGFHQQYLGPRDTNSPITDSLLSGFDPKRLRGEAPLLPASYAAIPDSVVDTLPHYNGQGCKAIGMTPTDREQGIENHIPEHLNTLPALLPAYN